MDENKIREIFGDKAFAAKVLELETPEEVQVALKEKGLELNMEQIMEMRTVMSKAAAAKDLNDEELMAYAGGRRRARNSDDIEANIAELLGILASNVATKAMRMLGPNSSYTPSRTSPNAMEDAMSGLINDDGRG